MDDDQLLRYSRQIMLPEIDVAGQEALLAASILVVGLGGLGSPAAMYLAAAGVGRLTLVDHDLVDLSNLQRQIVHRTSAIGEPKTASAARTLAELNPDCELTLCNERLSGERLRREVEAADLVLDASDNFSTRFAINRACVETATPLVSGAAIRLEGQVMVILPGPDNPCYRCLYDEMDDSRLNCAENGVLAPVVGIIGAIQALEAIKILTGTGRGLAGYLLVFDAYAHEWRKLQLPRDPQCPVCGPA